MELNGKTVDFSHTIDDDLPKFQQEDAVVIKYPRKGGKAYDFYKGTVNFTQSIQSTY